MGIQAREQANKSGNNKSEANNDLERAPAIADDNILHGCLLLPVMGKELDEVSERNSFAGQ